MTVRAFVFDFDDTLVDTLPDRANTICAAVRHVLGLDLKVDEAIKMIRSDSNLESQMETLAGTAGPVVKRLLEEYRERYYNPDRKPLSFFPGVYPALSSLRASGFRLALVTSRHRIGVDNTNHGVMRELERMGQAGLFEVVVGYEDTASHKPAPDPFLVCMDRLGMDADSAVATGDSPFGIQGARAAGLRTAAALWGANDQDALLGTFPDAVLATPGDLKTLLHNMCA